MKKKSSILLDKNLIKYAEPRSKKKYYYNPSQKNLIV